LTSLGLGVHISKGSERTIIGVIGDKRKLSDVPLELMNGVEKLIPIVESYKLASKTFKPEPSVIDVGGVKSEARKLLSWQVPVPLKAGSRLWLPPRQ